MEKARSFLVPSETYWSLSAENAFTERLHISVVNSALSCLNLSQTRKSCQHAFPLIMRRLYSARYKIRAPWTENESFNYNLKTWVMCMIQILFFEIFTPWLKMEVLITSQPARSPLLPSGGLPVPAS